MMLSLGLGLVVVLVAPPPPAEVAVVPDDMALVGPGELRLAYPVAGEPEVVTVPAFLLDARPVTNGDLLAFVSAVPKWRRGAIAGVYADARYLAHWADPLEPGDGGSSRADQPVTHVSWYAAKAYCAWRGRRLPSEREWELAASADETRPDARGDPAFTERVLAWYSRPTPAILPRAGAGAANVWGVRDLHGGVWEWVYDFNSTLVTGDNRDRGNVDKSMFCGAGAIGAKDVSDYATFMRFAFRSSLEARFTTRNLGFRCARDAAPVAREEGR